MDWVDGKAVECGDRCEILELDGVSFEGRILKVIKVKIGEINNTENNVHVNHVGFKCSQ